MKELPVVVVDVDRKAVANAKVTPWALRCSQGHGLWRADDKRAGVGPVTAVTDAGGTATVMYPLYRDVEEQIRTISVSLQVDHPDFAYQGDIHIDVPLEQDGPHNIELVRGVQVRVRPLINGARPNLAEIFVLWSDGRSWQPGVKPQQLPDGVLGIPSMPPGKNSLLVAQLSGDRATHSSGIVDFELDGDPRVIDVELEPCARLVGKLSDNVPRPVRQGRIKAWTLDPADAPIDRVNWMTWRAIEADGTFAIAGWPARERIQLIALCEGFRAASGEAPAGVEQRLQPADDPFLRPQVFSPCADTAIELKMVPLARCAVKVIDEDDKPIAGVTVVSWPNVGWWNGGSQIYCAPLARSERMLRLREYMPAIESVFPDPFEGQSDADGNVLLDLPAGQRRLAVQSDVYELPVLLGRRQAEAKLDVNAVSNVTLRLQPHGTERLGEWDKLAGVVFGCSTREGRRICALPAVQKKMDKFFELFQEEKNKNDPQLLADAYLVIADAFQAVGDRDESAKWLEKARQQASKAKPNAQN